MSVVRASKAVCVREVLACDQEESQQLNEARIHRGHYYFLITCPRADVDGVLSDKRLTNVQDYSKLS